MWYVTWQEVYDYADQIKKQYPNAKFYGVPRGGTIVAGLLGNPTNKIEDADVIVDDLIDSGKTQERYTKAYNKPFTCLIDKRGALSETWIVFPWEVKEQDTEETVEDNVRRLLQYFGEDVNREGLLETPKRYVKFFKEFLNPPKWNCTTFEGEGYDEMIVQKNIPFHSLCEHHIAPFFGEGVIAYIPNKKIVGLSKLARTLETYARRLQNQERITQQVAEFLWDTLEPKGVAVSLTAKHMCMEMRGVRKHNTWTTTNKLLGRFKEDTDTRNEFLSLIK
jgi:GTP cyclohydrolase I|tara:strand:+ start:3198 stop:4031 length:834 start_codon:yes stop_codon:yes gene_type:complete